MADSASMTIRLALRWAGDTLARAECESPRLDAEILLAEALGVDRVYLLVRADDALQADAWAQFRDWIARREKREPVAYIVGRREFFGLDFFVTPAVLIPRPETEHLVEEALAHARQLLLRAGVLNEVKERRSNDREDVAIADVGTGSGAIAVSLAVHLPQARICALDASVEALAVARSNAERHAVAERLCLLQSDLLENLPWPVDILAANLPYISDAEWDALAAEIRLYEPTLALRGGTDGLDAIRRLLREAPAHLLPGGTILLEIGAGQAVQVREVVREVFPGATVRTAQDYAGLDRVVVISPREIAEEGQAT